VAADPKLLPHERRTSPRAEVDVEISMESDHNFYTGLTQDISTGGLFVATHRLRSVGDRVSVTFTLPAGTERIAVETEVRWIRSLPNPTADAPIGMGLKFLKLTSQARKAIGSFLRERDSLFYDDE
jgi:uncharacterized protein (TIGR02266 family)